MKKPGIPCIAIVALMIVFIESCGKQEQKESQPIQFGQSDGHSVHTDTIKKYQQNQRDIQINPNTTALRYWEGISDATQFRDKQIATAEKYNNLAAVYTDRAYYQTAYHYLEKSLKLLADKPSTSHKQLLQTINLNKATLLVELGEIDIALEILTQKIAPTDDLSIRVLTNNNLLKIYIQTGNKNAFYALAAACLHEAEQTGTPYANQIYATVLNGYLRFDDLKLAHSMLQKFGTQFTHNNNKLKINYLNNHLQYLQKTGISILNAREITAAIQFANKTENYEDLRDLHYLASASQKRSGRMDSAFYHLSLADSFNNIQRDRLQEISKLDFATLNNLQIPAGTERQLLTATKPAAHDNKSKTLWLLTHLSCIVATIIVMSLHQKRKHKATTTETTPTPTTLVENAHQQTTPSKTESIKAQTDMAEFIKILQQKFPSLTPLEQKTCGYIYLGYHNKEIAKILNKSARSIESARFRARQKIGATKFQNFQNTLHNL